MRSASFLRATGSVLRASRMSLMSVDFNTTLKSAWKKARWHHWNLFESAFRAFEGEEKLRTLRMMCRHVLSLMTVRKQEWLSNPCRTNATRHQQENLAMRIRCQAHTRIEDAKDQSIWTRKLMTETRKMIIYSLNFYRSLSPIWSLNYTAAIRVCDLEGMKGKVFRIAPLEYGKNLNETMVAKIRTGSES